MPAGKPDKAKRGTRHGRRGAEAAWCSVEDAAGLLGDAELDLGRVDERRPEKAFARARDWRKRHWFVGTVLRLRQVFFNFGFQLVSARHDADLKKWLAVPANHKWLQHYVRDLWLEWVSMDCGVSVWFTSGTRPTLLNPEQCQYADEFGQETLKYAHGLTHQRIEEMSLSPAEKAILKKNAMLTLNAATNETGPFYFEVLKRDKVGCGLGLPGLVAAFPALSASDSLEAGDAVMSHMCRRVWEMHKMGHETRYGQAAGGKSNFWKRERADAFNREVKGKTGHLVTTTNFDHVVDFPRIDPKHFDEKRYDGVVRRLVWWSMPLGQILISQGQQPQLMGILEAQAQEERREVALHLALTLKAAFKLRVEDLQVQWSNECFRDPRVFADLLKAGLAAGPVSQASFLRAMGFDPEVERANKKKEAALPKEETFPLFDAAHGVNPASGNLNGRPAGALDGAARNGELAE